MNDMFFPALARFTQRYPELETEVVLTDRAVNLVEEGIDCAIRGVEVPTDAQLVARLLSPCRWLTCASPDYLASIGTPKTIDALRQHNCIRFISQSTGRPRDWWFSVRGKLRTVVPRGSLRLNSLDAAKQLAISGVGIVQIPDALGYDAVLNGQLEPLLTEHVASAPSLVVIYPGNRYLPAKVRAFAEFFMDVFPKEGWWPSIEAHVAEFAAQRELRCSSAHQTSN